MLLNSLIYATVYTDCISIDMFKITIRNIIIFFFMYYFKLSAYIIYSNFGITISFLYKCI